MPKIISIDPGLNHVAWAIWSEEGQLLSSALTRCFHDPRDGQERAEKWRNMARKTVGEIDAQLGSDLSQSRLAIEIPQVYSGPKAEDPNDLIDLAGVAGGIVSYLPLCSVEWSPQPREWKGQTPKHVTRKRVDERLSPEEKALIQWPIKSLAHNVYDALHIGLTYLEREGIREIPYPEKIRAKRLDERSDLS